MRYAIRPVALTAALAIFLIGSSGTARADDNAWKAAHDTDPHLPLTAEQVEMTAEKRAAEPQNGDAVLLASLGCAVRRVRELRRRRLSELCAPDRQSDAPVDELLLRPGIRP